MKQRARRSPAPQWNAPPHSQYQRWQPESQPTRRRRRSSRRGTRALACLIVTLGLLVLCLLVAIVPPVVTSRTRGRTNVLLVGVDRRAGNGWAYRADTIMIVTFDPKTGGAGLLSIPRDLQVPIPGHGEDRINTANVYGYLRDYPGGGPALLRDTIQANFGIPLDGTIMIDFRAFERIVDGLGGVDVEVPKALHDTQYPNPMPVDPYAVKTIHFDPGWQRMDGQRALEYARSRMSTSDFDRAKRQQLILLAIREKAVRVGAVPRWPALLANVLEGANTDLDLGDLLTLAYLAARIDTSGLKQVVLEHPLVVGSRRADGAAVQVPNWALIDPVLDDLFGPHSSR